MYIVNDEKLQMQQLFESMILSAILACEIGYVVLYILLSHPVCKACKPQKHTTIKLLYSVKSDCLLNYYFFFSVSWSIWKWGVLQTLLFTGLI